MVAVRQVALVSDESTLEACTCSRRCAIQIDLFLPDNEQNLACLTHALFHDKHYINIMYAGH